MLRELDETTRVYVGGVEIHGVQKATILMNNAVEQAEEAVPAFTESMREITLVFDNVSAAFRRLFLGWSFNPRPPYKQNKHRYGR